VDQIVRSDPEMLRDEPVYSRTRVPGVMIAHTLAAGDTTESIRQDSALTEEQIALAPERMKTYGMPAAAPAPPCWNDPPVRSARIVSRTSRE
jgi:hypothetical protein